MEVFVVFKWYDFRQGGNSTTILGLYKDMKKANEAFETEIKTEAARDDSIIERGEGYVNIIRGDDYTVIEIVKQPMIE